MQPLDTFPAAERRRIKGVFADIDDTITSDGRLTSDAYQALEQLREGGLMVFPITGRPAGWWDHIARMWPVDGVVGEKARFISATIMSGGNLPSAICWANPSGLPTGKSLHPWPRTSWSRRQARRWYPISLAGKPT
jgi:hypothetical protein